ncbi:MAG: sulfite exporter TauE/SafE family protein [Candidatus Gracilibacteria bacterium]|jgi:sulfite exporter TauE/SafE/copper chaperone CopZ
MKTIAHVKGMHCKSCEILLERGISQIDGVTKCTASHRKGFIEIYSDREIPNNELSDIVKGCGYEIVYENSQEGAGNPKTVSSKKNTFEDYIQIFLVFGILVIVSLMIANSGALNLLPSLGQETGVFIAVLFGIVASVSTCLALVGGIVMSFGSTYPVHESSKHPVLARAVPHLYFHIGRIGGFIILGGLLGMLGSKLNYTPSITAYLTIFVSAIMFYIGLHILNIVPNITKFGFHMPKFLSHKLYSVQDSEHYLAPILIGILTFFVPCGFTQAMQLSAVSSGSFIGGATIMGAFAFGTMPVLLSIGVGASYAEGKEFPLAKKVIGVIIVMFALYSINAGFILTGSGLNLTIPNNDNSVDNSASSEIKDGIQVVKMDVDWVFTPDKFTIKKGIPVRFEITGVNVSGCASSIVIPDFGIFKQISLGLNVIEFTPEETGTIPFSCGMGMIRGQFIVTD